MEGFVRTPIIWDFHSSQHPQMVATAIRRELQASRLTDVRLVSGCQCVLLLLRSCQLLDRKGIGSLEQLRLRKRHGEVRETLWGIT